MDTSNTETLAAQPRNELVQEAIKLRGDIKLLGKCVLGMKALATDQATAGLLAGGHDMGEIMANIMLSYRHLEDARMRLGKVLEAHDAGSNPYKQ